MDQEEESNNHRPQPAPHKIGLERGDRDTRLLAPMSTFPSKMPLPGPLFGHKEPKICDVICGPLLNFRNTMGDCWNGSILIVTSEKGSTSRHPAMLFLRELPPDDHQRNQQWVPGSYLRLRGKLIHSQSALCFWRFDISLEMALVTRTWEYTLSETHPVRGYSLPTFCFAVPAKTESMRIMFYSCNGWCDGAEKGEWNHLSLWKDVLRQHKTRAFHVMIGGGDQIYNDGIYEKGPLLEWTQIKNPQERLQYKPPDQLKDACDIWYLSNYIQWYNREPFASALSQIPSLTIWDDHDIIDGFGSYAKETMECSVFQMIGSLAHKYYMIFQHHLPPDTPDQAKSNVVTPSYASEPEYILGSNPGPYIKARSRSIFTRLGARMAFLGIDARTERTREQTNYYGTYDAISNRVDNELQLDKRSGRTINHLILLLGIPIAYAPLTWIESAFVGKMGETARYVSENMNIGKTSFNLFDGEVELLDDLNDHYTAKAHQKERLYLIQRIQAISEAHSVRVTILSGDVHLAAVGRFFTNRKVEKLQVEEDFRFMNNIISSAIVNQPPPPAMAKLIAKSDKLRDLDENTEEVLFKLFRLHGSGQKLDSPGSNVAMTRRNFTVITENSPLSPGRYEGIDKISYSQFFSVRGHRPLHFGEANAGTKHIAASLQHGKGNDGSLDICICVEEDHRSHDGRTVSYGFTIPVLRCKNREAAGTLC